MNSGDSECNNFPLEGQNSDFKGAEEPSSQVSTKPEGIKEEKNNSNPPHELQYDLGEAHSGDAQKSDKEKTIKEIWNSRILEGTLINPDKCFSLLDKLSELRSELECTIKELKDIKEDMYQVSEVVGGSRSGRMPNNEQAQNKNIDVPDHELATKSSITSIAFQECDEISEDARENI